jgi:hypothetical protein
LKGDQIFSVLFDVFYPQMISITRFKNSGMIVVPIILNLDYALENQLRLQMHNAGLMNHQTHLIHATIQIFLVGRFDVMFWIFMGTGSLAAS